MKTKTHYVDQSLPEEVDVPRIPGTRYQAQVPGTLDLTEQCGIAVNALTRCVDPDMDNRGRIYPP